MVVAAETGSGKTHSYLVPLIHKLGTISAPPENELTHDALQNQEMILVLCPNVMLCEQAVAMTNSLLDQSRKQLVKVAAVCGQKGWPMIQPDVLVSTPGALLNYLSEYDREKRRRDQFLHRVKFVVFDKADMLLCGRWIQVTADTQVDDLLEPVRYSYRSDEFN